MAAEAERLRRRLVAEIAAENPEIDPRVLSALGRVPRHLFVPDVPLAVAYANHALSIGHGQTISQPTVVALMTDALELSGRERVLEVGTGSGYQTAVLAQLAAEVFSLEVVPELSAAAAERLGALGLDNVRLRVGDGYRGWPEEAPFDRIVLTAAPPELPDELVRQLPEGGLLVAPVGSLDQWLGCWRKTSRGLVGRTLGAVRFVPMVRPASR